MLDRQVLQGDPHEFSESLAGRGLTVRVHKAASQPVARARHKYFEHVSHHRSGSCLEASGVITKGNAQHFVWHVGTTCIITHDRSMIIIKAPIHTCQAATEGARHAHPGRMLGLLFRRLWRLADVGLLLLYHAGCCKI